MNRRWLRGSRPTWGSRAGSCPSPDRLLSERNLRRQTSLHSSLPTLPDVTPDDASVRPDPAAGGDHKGVRTTMNNLGDFLWAMVAFFFWVMAIWIFISIFGDIFRRDDLTGVAKAGWILLIFILPFLGALIYIIARPKVTAQDVRLMTQAEAANKAAAGVSTADELTKLQQLRDAGAITPAEYDALKAKAIAG